MSSFALYRLPCQQRVVLTEQTEGMPAELQSYEELNERRGFVVAPFTPSLTCPILFIRPDRNAYFPTWKDVSLQTDEMGGEGYTPAPGHSYAADFARFHDCLATGDFQKIVLSRCEELKRTATATPLALFQRACQLYPRLFIALTYTPRSGLWLTATPEILLEGNGREWHTIALAGTMRQEDNGLEGKGWSEKNVEEQRIVARYIKDCLKRFSNDIEEEGPRTVAAANLLHLRSDFTFTLYNNARASDLLQALHPTPAVCGLPKEKTLRFILDNEHTPRLYYSGFMGPLNFASPTPGTPCGPSGQENDTHLFVSLRCMQITGSHYRLYAGGGLLKESTEEKEWQETEAKMETMRRCLA